MWRDITPDMMTEEETAGEEGYIHHQPDWRSTHFNSFTRKLDSRLSPSFSMQYEVRGLLRGLLTEHPTTSKDVITEFLLR